MSTNPRVVNVSQEVTPTFAPAAPQQRTVVASADTGSAIAANLTGLAGQIIKAGMAGARQDKLGGTVEKLQAELEGLLGKGATTTERNSHVTRRLAELEKAGDIRGRDFLAIRKGLQRRSTKQEHVAGKNYTVDSQTGEILGQPTGVEKATQMIMKQGEEVQIAFPASSGIWTNDLAPFSPSYNQKVLNSAHKLSTFLEVAQKEQYSPTNLPELKANVKTSRAEFKSLLASMEWDIMNPEIARAMGEGTGKVNPNTPRLAIQTMYDDLRKHLMAEPGILTGMGMTMEDFEAMANKARTTATEFGTNARGEGAVTTLQLMKTRRQLELDIEKLRVETDVFSQLPEDHKRMLARADFIKDAVNVATSIAEQLGDPNMKHALLAPFVNPVVNTVVTGFLKRAEGAIERKGEGTPKANYELLEQMAQAINSPGYWATRDMPALVKSAERIMEQAKIPSGEGVGERLATAIKNYNDSDAAKIGNIYKKAP